MRCSALCLASDGEAFDEAVRAAATMDRFSRAVRTVEGLGGGWKAVGLALEGEGMPMVHGLPGLEYCSLEASGTSLRASRDQLGTRPLYVAKSGRWVASDHRFFRTEEAELLPPGATIDIESWAVQTRAAGPAPFDGSFDEAAGRLAELVSDAVRDRVAGRKRVAVAFSGGLDSSLLAHCASKHAKVVACTASARGSVDEAVAKGSADVLGVEFAGASIDRASVARELRSMDLPFRPGEMDAGLWSVYSSASRLASESGAELVMLGQLADELFGGYSKYERRVAGGDGEGARRLMESDVLGCGMGGFARDELACSRWLQPSFPFADGRVATFGLSLPVELKIRDGTRKAVLREAALRLGLPRELAFRRKKAAQYSSGVLKLVG